MPRLFVSYSHNDRFVAETLALQLKAEGYEAWIDFDGLTGGDVWEKAIEHAIRQADRLLVIVTPTARASEWVRKEIEIARRLETRVIPLIMARFDSIPDALNQLGIADLQAVDFITAGMETGLQQLRKALPPLEKVPEPAQKSRIEQRVNYQYGGAVIAEQTNIYHYASPPDPQDTAGLHKEYLRAWFTKPWAHVSLADIASYGGRASLLAIYVPLPVDFRLIVKTENTIITDWWVHIEEASREMNVETERPHQRTWPSLKVGESQLQQIVDGIQKKSDQREYKPDDGGHSWTMEAHDAASIQPRMVLVGDPGSGKSSFVRHLALCLAGAELRGLGEPHVPDKASLEALRDWLLGAYTPIYIELRDLVAQTFPALPKDKSQPPPLPDLNHFWDYIKRFILGDRLAAYQPELQKRLTQGQAIILLDGLDEVADAADSRRRDQIKALIASLEVYPAARIIITSRPHAYRQGDWSLPGYGRTDLQPLSPDRLQELAQALFAVLLPAQAEAESQAFFQALANVPEELHRNPLFFTLLAAIWLRTPEHHHLPQTRGALYRQGLDLMLEKWTLRKGISLSVSDLLGLETSQLRRALEITACQVHQQATPGQDSTEFHRSILSEAIIQQDEEAAPGRVWKHLEQRAGILISGRDEHFRFAHRSFQEHLAACRLTTREQDGLPVQDRFPQGLVQRVLEQPDLWSNVTLLAADELVTDGRESSLWELLPALFSPYLRDNAAPERAQAGVLALTLIEQHQLHTQEWGEWSPQRSVLRGAQQAGARLITDLSLPPDLRASSGRALAGLGDPRQGITTRKKLPDIAWAAIPAGLFFMGGDPDALNAWEGMEINLPGFFIARYPVTVAQYTLFVEGDGYTNRDYWTAAGWAWKGDQTTPQYWQDSKWHVSNHPVVGVTWYEAYAFCQWLNTRGATLKPNPLMEIRLPTEAEWEKAARYPHGWKYPWGEDYRSGYANIDETQRHQGDYSLERTTPVGMYPQASTPSTAIHDLSGNVWEWCQTKWAAIYTHPGDHTAEGDAPRCCRGGSWDLSASHARAAARYRRDPLAWNFGPLGFRVVCGAAIQSL